MTKSKNIEKKFESVKDRITDKLKDNNKAKILVIIAIAGLALILISDLIKPAENKQQDNVKIDEMSVNTDEYKLQIQKELKNILSKISGVGNVDVMMTIEGSTEYVFAEEFTTKSDSGVDTNSQDYSNKYVTIDKGTTNEALIKKILKPQVAGVIIVCDGGNNPQIIEKIYQAASSVLNISSSKICIAKR